MATAPKSKKKAPPTTAAEKAAAPLGRYLRKFTLQNVRTFRSPVTLDFCHEDGSVAQWTVILGENGTGKTTLLQYLAGMVPTDKIEAISKPTIQLETANSVFGPTLLGQSWQSWNRGNISQLCAGTLNIEAELHVSTPTSAIKEAKAIKKELALSLLICFKKKNEFFERQYSGTWAPRTPEFLKQLRLFAYGASRHIAGPASPYLSSQTFSQNGDGETSSTLYQDDQPLISPEQWFLGLHHTARSNGDTAAKAEQALTSAQRCFTNVLPDVGGLTVKAHALGRGQSAMALMCQTPFGEVPFGALSVGYRTMAAWLTDFVKRMHEAYPELEEPDNGPAIVLIDEFDLHMHPKWQREAMAALSKEFPNTQFIVTAHSPLIVQATEGNAKLIVLRRFQRADGTEEVLVDDHPRYAAGWRVDQILSSDLYNLDPRSPKYDGLMEESIRLRQKERRTAKEEKRLREIETELEREAPPGTSSASRQLFADLEQALQKAHKNGK